MKFPHNKPYRKAHADLLIDVEVESPKRARRLRHILRAVVPGWFGSQKEVLSQVRKLFKSELSLGGLCDIFAFALALDLEFKQILLDELDVEKRAHRLIEYLESRPACAKSENGKHKFPPEFSIN